MKDSLLLRQVRKHLGTGLDPAGTEANWSWLAGAVSSATPSQIQGLITDIHRTYQEADTLRRRLSHALRQSSDELFEANQVLERRAAQMELLYEVTRAARDEPDLESCLRVCLRSVCRALSWPIGHAFIRERGYTTLTSSNVWFTEPIAGAQVDLERLKAARTAVDVTGETDLVGRVVASLVSQATTDLMLDPAQCQTASGTGIRSAMAFPILIGKEIIAVLEFFHTIPQNIEPQTLELMNNLGRQAGDMTARHRAELERATQVALLNATLDSSPEGVLVVDRSGKVLLANERFAALWRIPLNVIASGNDDRLIACVTQQLKDPEGFLSRIRELYGDETLTAVDELEFLDGRVFHRYTQAVRVAGESIARIWVFQDITAQRRAELQHATLEEQLRHSQKMEAIGQLAGGVAHDFNNLLTVITGYGELAKSRIRPEDPVQSDLDEVLAAGGRAASLTRQLLAFSRQQVMAPKVMDLNVVVSGLAKMLRRILGEDIELDLSLNESLGNVKADPGQLEQVLLNLVVNGRDAMESGGTLRIETCNVEVNPDLIDGSINLPAGSWVSVAVMDTGPGIPPDVLPRIFEPFFTTKELGKGTGLGLSMVYGIVSQSGGRISVDTDRDAGACFRIHLPRVQEPVDRFENRDRMDALGGSETIFLAEDDAIVHNLVRDILTDRGYTVLEAANGSDALWLCARHQGVIDLLLTDVVMPGMSGRELYERLLPTRPNLRVLFMSGYPRGSITNDDLIRPGTAFMQKPFTIGALERKVREILDGPRVRAA